MDQGLVLRFPESFHMVVSGVRWNVDVAIEICDTIVNGVVWGLDLIVGSRDVIRMCYFLIYFRVSEAC